MSYDEQLRPLREIATHRWEVWLSGVMLAVFCVVTLWHTKTVEAVACLFAAYLLAGISTIQLLKRRWPSRLLWGCAYLAIATLIVVARDAGIFG
jgi:hypothetical protein